jgi:hypothetical protein
VQRTQRIRRLTRSLSLPGKRRSTSRDDQRSPSYPSSHVHHRRTRSASTPAQMCTVPLRECCKACIPIVEEFLAAPSQPEQMSPGAQRIHSQGLPCVDKVRVDEVDAIADTSSTRLRLDLSQQKPLPLPQQCIVDEDEADLFPLPTPSPRNSPRQSPRNSPTGSPNASLTNLVANNSPPELPARRASPLSKCYGQGREEHHTRPINIPTPPLTLPPRDHCIPTTASAPDISRSPRRASRKSSFSGFGEAVSRGGITILKGISDLRMSPT